MDLAPYFLTIIPLMFKKEELQNELSYKAVLSGGPGGQHANKASTKVILEWKLDETQQFSEKEIRRLQHKLKSHLTKANILQLHCDETRSQHRNKAIVTKRFFHLVKTGLEKPKSRKRPKPGKKYHQKRLEDKKRRKEKKKWRQDPLK